MHENYLEIHCNQPCPLGDPSWTLQQSCTQHVIHGLNTLLPLRKWLLVSKQYGELLKTKSSVLVEVCCSVTHQKQVRMACPLKAFQVIERHTEVEEPLCK